jgi:hypothetical protein
MTADHDLERRVTDHYASEAPRRAPDWVLDSALATIDTTQQRRALIRVPWRFPIMNNYAKVAVAAVVVIAVGAVGLAVLRPGTAPSVGTTPSPSPVASPDPSAPPPLSDTFDSTIHGISISYPSGWTATPATERWRSQVQFNFGPTLDHLSDPRLRDHLFLSLSSQPLDGKTGEAWVNEFLDHPDLECGDSEREPITVDGARGLICESIAAVSAGDRGFMIWFYRSTDESWTGRFYDNAWFRSVVDTAQFRPEAAVDTAIPLTNTFTSDLHGISVSYPVGWVEAPATAPWARGLPNADEGARDTIDDGQGGSRFIGLASQPLDGKTGQAWADGLLADPGMIETCTPTVEPRTVDGATGQLATCPNGLLTAQVWTADRGYWIVLFGSADRAWFEDILATVRLHPEDAVPAAKP